jgi:serine/threonine protein kinase
VARALTRAHAIGIVHRDLKPENVFLVPDDEGEIAKVLDFGVAKWNTDWAVNNVTKTGLLVGTPLYMSPEQARGTKDIDFRADLWSLAVIAFQAMTGSLPFVSEGLGDLLAKIMFEPIPMPSSIVPYLPLEFDDWWVRASSRDIDARFQSAKQLSDALAVALGLTAASTVAAAPPGFREAAMSDYSLSVSSGEGGVSEHDGSRTAVWPSTKTGKLLGAGVFGVTLIAATMSFQKYHDAARGGQLLISPTAPLATGAPVAEPAPSPAAIPASVEATVNMPGSKEKSARDAAPKPERKESRRGTLPRDLPRDIPPAPPPPRVVVEPLPTKAAPTATPTATPPNKPKDVDFGI